MKTLLTNGVVVTCDEDHRVYAPGDLVMQDDRIAFVGPIYEGEVDRRVDARGRLLMPGLINAHTHSPMSIFRGLADDVDLRVFLEERVWPREIRMTGDDAYAGAILSGVEMLKSGVTSYVDMYFFEEDLVRAALDLGLRAVITPAILETPAWTPLLGHWEKRTSDVIDFCRRWEGHEGRIRMGLGPHAPYTLPFEALGEIATAARAAGLPLNMHVLETRHERDAFNREHRVGTIAALEEVGFFEGDVIAAHSIWLEGGDVDVYRRHRVGVAHCPQSNAKLGAGIAPIVQLVAQEVQVGLGTDGPATNNNLDLWEELRLAPLLAKVSAHDPTVLPARQALAMATSMGSCAIHQPDTGVLRKGAKADVLMISIEDTTLTPVFDSNTYVDHLVYSAGRELVDAVWVNGQQVVSDGEVLTVDEEAACHAAQEAAVALSARMQGQPAR